MLKQFRRLNAIDWLIVLVLTGFVVGQVNFDLKLPEYTQTIMLQIQQQSEVSAIWQTGIRMLVAALGSLGCSVAVSFIAAYFSAGFSRRLRFDLFAKVQSFSFQEVNSFSTPSLITRSTNDIQQVQMSMMMILRMAVSAPITAVWAIVKIQRANFELTLATIVAVVLLVIVLLLIFSAVLKKFKLVQKLTDSLNAVTRENLTGLRVVKAYNADDFQQQKFENVNNQVLKNNLFINRVMGLTMPVIMITMNYIVLVIYWWGAEFVNSGSLDFPTMTAFSGLVMQVLMAFMMLTVLFIMVPRAAVSARRINEVLDTPLSISDPTDPKEFVFEHSIAFKNVSFRYPGAADYVLQDINFEILKGETVAVIGSTGSGKSTLVNLLPRFYDASEGEILIDGIDIRSFSQQTLRKSIGYVPQKGILFSGTVCSNIAFSDEGMDIERVKRAARISEAAEFVESMEGGYNAPISQSGKNVSGGQRQRLAIARAVAAEPDVFIFDDSFSALDFKTDRAVRANLHRELTGKTSLIVAQRIGTIVDADRIIVLDEGKMVGMGKHGELLKSCEVYRQIALSQLSEAELGL